MSRDAILTAYGKTYRWTPLEELRDQRLQVVGVFEFRDGFVIRAKDGNREWLIDVALPDQYGVWREIEATL